MKNMYKTCKHCGIVPHDHVCPYARPRYKNNTYAYKFRSSREWQLKREEIKQRDGYRCKACEALMSGTIYQYNGEDLQVHHIVKVEVNPDKRLDNDNLITLCRYHHEEAEKNNISKEDLIKLIKDDG